MRYKKMWNQLSFCGSYQDSISRMLYIDLQTFLTVFTISHQHKPSTFWCTLRWTMKWIG